MQALVFEVLNIEFCWGKKKKRKERKKEELEKRKKKWGKRIIELVKRYFLLCFVFLRFCV